MPIFKAFRSDPTIDITIVYDEAVMQWINILRFNIKHVQPRVNFSSCCTWMFKDEIFQNSRSILVILSKRMRPFNDIIFRSLQTCKENNKQPHVCLVIESDDNEVEGIFTELVGDRNICVISDLANSFVWLPKVCQFIFSKRSKISKIRKKAKIVPLPTCAIANVVNDSTLRALHSQIIDGLKKVNITLREDLVPTPDYCILIRKKLTDDLNTRVSGTVRSIEKTNSLVFDYVIYFDDTPKADSSKRVTYGASSQVLFIVHLLHVLGVIKVEAIHKRKPTRLVNSFNLNPLNTIFCVKVEAIHKRKPTRLVNSLNLNILNTIFWGICYCITGIIFILVLIAVFSIPFWIYYFILTTDKA